MSFTIDEQSLGDLNIPGKHRSGSIYSLFNRTKTDGGEQLLEKLFREPLADAGAINARCARFRYFQSLGLAFPFTAGEVQRVETYLGSLAAGRLTAALEVVQHKVLELTVRSERYGELVDGVTACFGLIRGVRCLVQKWDAVSDNVTAGDHRDMLARMKQLLEEPKLLALMEKPTEQAGAPDRMLSLTQVFAVHVFFAGAYRTALHYLLEMMYELDLSIAVAEVALENGLGYPEAVMPQDGQMYEPIQLRAKGLRHPALAKAVANDLTLDTRHHVLFLTGANMAGKSTLMKSIGTNLYLAHLGFPVAAETFTFSVMEGIYSSINVPDNIQQGYSHFYAEVLRVKDVATDVGSGKRLLVLFDELFKGTNVQDAYEATLAVVEAFSKHRQCLFIVSTHITEVGEALKERVENVQFRFLPTAMEGVDRGIHTGLPMGLLLIVKG